MWELSKVKISPYLFYFDAGNHLDSNRRLQWLQMDGISHFSAVGRKRVVLYPDAGMFAKWEEKAAILRNGGVDATVSRACEGLPHNWDVADVLLRERHAKEE